MADPGIGTVVLYETGDGYLIPAIVVVTHNSWTSDMLAGLSVAQPTSGEVLLMVVEPNGSPSAVSSVSEGTTAGTYRLIEMEATD